ncbi:MAG: DUF2785 domain-containing protein [Anaerolineae bacterium]|nr:DUF2785 domain-containing protein [Anaerolineae bacterium]
MKKSFWQTIIHTDFAVPNGHTIAELVPELVSVLGSTDPVWRDEIGYTILVNWITRDLIPPDDLRGLIAQLSAFLTVGLGEQDTDTVFLRSFSVLILAGIIYHDNRHRAFLTEAEVHDLMNKTLAYFEVEKDLRGYVPDKGWAHSCAHTADLIDEFTISRYSQPADLERMMNAIRAKIMAPTGYVYLHNEDGRLCVAVMSTLARDVLPVAFWEGWFRGFLETAARGPAHNIARDPAAYSAYLNSKHFLRSLYFWLLVDGLPASAQALRPRALATVKVFNR